MKKRIDDNNNLDDERSVTRVVSGKKKRIDHDNNLDDERSVSSKINKDEVPEYKTSCSHKQSKQSPQLTNLPSKRTIGESSGKEICSKEKNCNEGVIQIVKKKTAEKKICCGECVNVMGRVFYFVWYKVLRFREEPLENTFKKLMITIMSMVFSLFMLLGWMFSKDIVVKIIMIVFNVAFIINTVIYFLLKNYKRVGGIFLFIVSLCFNAVFVFLIANSNAKGILFNSIYHCFIIIPVVNILLDGCVWIWVFVYIVLMIVALVLEFVLKFPAPTNLESSRNSFVIQKFTVDGMVHGFVLLTAIYFKIVASKERRLISKISESIADLNLDNKFINKIMKTKSYSEIVDQLKIVVENMRSYRSFLPNNLVKNYANDLQKRSSSLHHVRSSVTSFSSRSSQDSGSSGGTNREGSFGLKKIKSKKKKAQRDRKDVNILEKIVTVLQIQIHIRENTSKKSEEDVQYLFRVLMNIVLPLAEQNGGNIFNIFDNSCYICWNATAISINSMSKAAALVFLILDRWEKKNIAFSRLLFSVVTRSFFIGNFGSNEYRRFNISSGGGNGVKDLNLLCNLNFKHGTKFLIDQHVYNDLKYDYYLKQIDYVPEHDLDIFEVISSKASSEGNEWMYQIGYKDLICQEYEDAWVFYKKGDFEKALLSLSKLKQDDKYVQNFTKLIKGQGEKEFC